MCFTPLSKDNFTYYLRSYLAVTLALFDRHSWEMTTVKNLDNDGVMLLRSSIFYHDY